MNIVLIGLMGSGKTTLGKRLSELMSFSFVDTDALIESSLGQSIKQIFESQGETGFRKIESETLSKLTNSTSQVISTGGGIILSDENRHLLPQLGRVYWLNPSLEALTERLQNDTTRPLLQGQDSRTILEKLMAERGHYYETCSDSVIDTSDATKIESIALDIKKDFEAHYDSKH